MGGDFFQSDFMGGVAVSHGPTGYLNGLEVSYASASTVQIAAGTCRDSTDAKDIDSSGTLTADITAAGANGLDTGAEANSTWYYIWIISNGSTTASLLSVSATTPTMPSGYVAKRLVGAVRNDSAGDFYPFYASIGKDIRKFHYKIALADARLRVALGAITTASSWNSADCSKAVPPIADELYVGVYYDNGNAGSNSNCHVSPKGFPEAGNGFLILSAANNGWDTSHMWLPNGDDSTLRVKVDVQNADSVDIDIIGWSFVP